MTDPKEKCPTCDGWTIILKAPETPAVDAASPFRKALPTVVCPRCDKYREMT